MSLPLAEVMDKVPGVNEIWGTALLLMWLSFLASRLSRFLGAAMLMIEATGAYLFMRGINSIGRYIDAETDGVYFIHCYAAIASVIVATCVFTFMRRTSSFTTLPARPDPPRSSDSTRGEAPSPAGAPSEGPPS